MAFECVTWTNKETAMNNAKKHVFKHEYLRSRAYICLSLSSPSSSDISIKSWTIEILMLKSWIPESKNFVK